MNLDEVILLAMTNWPLLLVNESHDRSLVFFEYGDSDGRGRVYQAGEGVGTGGVSDRRDGGGDRRVRGFRMAQG